MHQWNCACCIGSTRSRDYPIGASLLDRNAGGEGCIFGLCLCGSTGLALCGRDSDCACSAHLQPMWRSAIKGERYTTAQLHLVARPLETSARGFPKDPAACGPHCQQGSRGLLRGGSSHAVSCFDGDSTCRGHISGGSSGRNSARTRQPWIRHLRESRRRDGDRRWRRTHL